MAARLWLRPARRRRGRLVASAVWIIIDGNRHVATGCLKHEAREAEKRLAAYIADKYRPSRHARDIDQIDIADVLSMYLDDCGPRILAKMTISAHSQDRALADPRCPHVLYRNVLGARSVAALLDYVALRQGDFRPAPMRMRGSGRDAVDLDRRPAHQQTAAFA